MFNADIIIPASTKIPWGTVVAIISIGTAFGSVMKLILSRVSKRQYREDLKELKESLEKVETSLKNEIECKEIMNTTKHAELRADITMSENRLREESKSTIEQIQLLIRSIDSKINILIAK